MTEQQAHGAINRVGQSVKAGRRELAGAGCRHRLGRSRSQIRFCGKRHSSDGTRGRGRGGRVTGGCSVQVIRGEHGGETGTVTWLKVEAFSILKSRIAFL